jgi:hypothetical protein
MDFHPDYLRDQEIAEILREKTDLDRLVLRRNGEKYEFRYDHNSRDALLKVFGEMAADKDYSITWYDAAVLSQALRKIEEETLQMHSSLHQGPHGE